MEPQRALAITVDLAHALTMIVWALGLPLLFWHRFQRLSRFYVWFCISFLGVSIASHAALGECVLTTLSRYFWRAAGGYRGDVPFVVLLVNEIAQVRPSTRSAVLAWQIAIVVSSASVLWYFRQKGRQRERSTKLSGRRSSSHSARGTL